MRRANIKGALVGVEAVTPEGLKDVYKGFNDVGEALVTRLRTFRDHGVGVLGSFIFGLPSDRPSTFAATADIADRAGVAFAQFVMLTPYPGTVDFAAWEKSLGEQRGPHWRHPGDTALVDPAGAASQGVRASSRHVPGRDSREDAGRLGPFLQSAAHLGAIAGGGDHPGSNRVRFALEVVPADVREHRDRHRQRAGEPREPMGPVDRSALPASVHGASTP